MTQDEAVKLALKLDRHMHNKDLHLDLDARVVIIASVIVDACEKAREEEREACAAIAREQGRRWESQAAIDSAFRIRARGTKKDGE